MKTILKSAVLVASLLGVLSPASAETLHARIPFGFSAGGTAMPAGVYAIRPIPSTSALLLFENEETKQKVLVLARSTTTLDRAKEPLTFSSSLGDRMELTNIVMTVWTYELSMHPVRDSQKGASLALASAK